MYAMKGTQAGFTLVEMAVVLVIIGFLLGGLLAPLATQIEQGKRNETLDQLEEIKDAILGFAMANDRLPCPAVPNSAGTAGPVAGGACTTQHGFVPAVTLGLAGPVNLDGLLLDAWQNPIRYSVTRASGWAFTTTNGIVLGMVPGPDLVVCDTASSSNSVCSAGANTLTADAPVVLYSMGKDGARNPTSAEQNENGEATTAAGLNGPLGNQYWVNRNNGRVFASAGYRDDAGNEFDDLVTWISPNILYFRMDSAGVL